MSVHLFLVDLFLPLSSFNFFCSIDFTMDLHLYDTEHHDTTHHDNLPCVFFIIKSFILNISIHKYFFFWKMCFCVKITTCIKWIGPNSTYIMCSLIIEKYINCPNQYELLSLVKFNYFYNIKKKISKHHKPKTIKFLCYNKYEDIENWLREQNLLYSSLQNSKNSQLGTNVT
jgi:hypothetical protein